jgi:hypothetical protein
LTTEPGRRVSPILIGRTVAPRARQRRSRTSANRDILGIVLPASRAHYAARLEDPDPLGEDRRGKLGSECEHRAVPSLGAALDPVAAAAQQPPARRLSDPTAAGGHEQTSARTTAGLETPPLNVAQFTGSRSRRVRLHRASCIGGESRSSAEIRTIGMRETHSSRLGPPGRSECHSLVPKNRLALRVRPRHHDALIINESAVCTADVAGHRRASNLDELDLGEQATAVARSSLRAERSAAQAGPGGQGRRSRAPGSPARSGTQRRTFPRQTISFCAPASCPARPVE